MDMQIPTVSIDTDGKVTWNEVTGATGYEISFDNNTWTVATSGSETIDKSSTGEKTAYVRATSTSPYYNSPSNIGSKTVTVYSLGLNKDTGIAEVTGAGNYVNGKEVSIGATASEGYTWNTWSVESGNAPAALASATTTITITQNTILQATSNLSTYQITYNGLEETNYATTNPNPSSYSIVSETFTLANPTKNGYEFLGWAGTGLSSATQTVTVSKGSTGARSYTATWKVDTITYSGGKTFDSTAQGDVIKFNGEEFTVIKKTSTQLLTIPKYNITLSTTDPKQQKSGAGDTWFANWGGNCWGGATDTINMSDSKNRIQRYITAYSNKLHSIDSRVSARVARKSEVTADGVTHEMRNPGDSSCYWLGSASSSDYVWFVGTKGRCGESGIGSVIYYNPNNEDDPPCGVRPLVIFNKS